MMADAGGEQRMEAIGHAARLKYLSLTRNTKHESIEGCA
jgi:hypothetical protein